MSEEIHGRNVKAGWWSNIKTGKSILKTRNRAELLMLVVSEASEAFQGFDNDLADDKLPHLPMYQVEIADVAIRLFDMIWAEESLAETYREFDYPTQVTNEAQFCDRKVYDWQLMRIVNHCSAAMEHIRKGRQSEYTETLVTAVACTFAIAKDRQFDLWDVINQKLAFNLTRADHQVKNRKLKDGKKF